MQFEFQILDFIRNNLTSPVLDRIMVFITTLGNGGAIWITLAVLMLISKKYRKTGIVLAAGLLASLIVGNLILKPLIARPRPFWVNTDIHLIIPGPTDFSLPSGHTLVSTISAVILIMENRRLGIWAAVLAFLIAFSRLYLYVHFPTDVLAGAVIGIFIGVFVTKIVNYFLQKNSKHTK